MRKPKTTPARREPASAFDLDYQREVQPRLGMAVTAHAMLVADGAETFEQAVGAVMSLACGYGAGYLTDGSFHDLVGWVITDLSDACEREFGP